MKLKSRPATDAEYWVTVSSDGRIVAQGSQRLCQRVAERGPWYRSRQGDLFEQSGSIPDR